MQLFHLLQIESLKHALGKVKRENTRMKSEDMRVGTPHQLAAWRTC